MSLTPEGQFLCEKAEAILPLLARAVEDTRQLNRNYVPVITVGVSRDELLPHKVIETLDNLNKSTGMRVVLEQESYQGLISGLERHSYDLIITTDRNIRTRNDFDYLPLRRFELVLAVSKKHPKAEKEFLSPQDFKDEQLLIALPDGKDVPHNVIASVYNNCGGEVNLVFFSTPSDTVLNVAIGSGIAIVSNLVDQKLYPGIRFVHFEDRFDSYQHLVWRKNESSPVTLACRDAISACAAPVL